jgi:hypothetical protein
MKKITLVFLFCICAVGFGQAQVEMKKSNPAVSNSSKIIFEGGDSKTANVVSLTGESRGLVKSISAPIASRAIINSQNQTRLFNDTYNNELLTGFSGYLDYTTNNYGTLNTSIRDGNRETLVINSSGRMAVTTYTDLATFQGDAGVLVAEDFSNGPADFTICGSVISSAGDGCFPAGELVDGFDSQVSNTGDVIFIGNGSIPGPNPLDLVGPASFAEYAIINFTGSDDVFSVGMEIWNNLDVDTDFRVYDGGGILLDSFIINNATNTSNFFGIVSTDAIGRIEVEGLNGSGELFGAFTFTAPGSGALAFPLTFEAQVVPFNDFNGSATQVIANPDASGVNTSANVAENVVPANAAFAGVNIVIPVDLTDDKFFSMNVWSPLTDTPILLKLEGGPNPPIERQVNMTTTGAWEEIVFDFSSEGAITFDSATLFMNFNVLDPANQTYYWDNLDQMNSAGGGGGGMACSQENPLSAAAGGGLGSSVDSDFKTASDIVVTAGEDFTIDTIDAYFLTFAPSDPPTTAIIAYYEDAGGLPGALLGTETVVPTIVSAQPWANPVADQYETTMSVTPFTFAGDAGSDTTYWIEISMGTATNQATVFWENTNDTPVVGNPAAQFDGTAGTWAIPDPINETVYLYSGECTPIVGPVDNDVCADAFAVACGDTLSGDTSDGNTDDNGDGSADEWFAFTSTTVGELVTASTCDQAAFDTILTVYDSCGGAVVATNDDGTGCTGFTSKVNFIADGSSTYYIAVDGFGGATGTFDLSVTCTTGPVNDDCSGALPMACGEIVAGTTVNATEDSAVAPTCDTSVTAPGVWYVYEDTTGLITDITITMCNGTTDYDSKLSVYTGDCGAPPFDCVVGNDDTCGLQSEVSFQSDGATTFYILVHGFGANEGNFEIEMTCNLVPPPNDMIANSIDVDEIGFPYTDPSVAMPAATFEAGSPVDCDNAGARGVWYNFVSANDGTATATITTPGAGGLLFTVNNGPLAGSYDAIAAAFGGAFTTTAITSDTVVILDDDTTGDANDACDPILNGADLSGKIAIARRGACAFTDKVIAAQNAGAIAVIVVNNQPGGPIVMGGDNPDITIPALMLGDADGEAVITEVLGGGSLNATMVLEPAGFSAVTFYTAPNENAVETDLVLVNWFENQCLPGTTASIPTVAGQAYYVYVANHDAVTDIVIDGTNLGTEDNTIEGFSYYPNPAGSTLNLSAQDTIESVVIYNMLGQKVFDQNVNAIRSELNVSDLATGTYILQVSVNGQIGTYQILKK